ncbi:MAG: methanogenesis marker protein Mmp4/MtxX [Methanobacterium sp.]|uniref:methanogenesis marker protein Mmp4/MtxX n=1 Tax=Methanobacterium sp. TaxID=2164 RepID=UPI003D64DF66|nr:methanogenesis marker protein Mmp4/MtxX [Methanobacterium sp.]
MKIAAGIGNNKNIVEASKKVDFEVVLTESEDDLVDMLFNKEVDAAVRGSLSASKIMERLKEKYSNKICRASLLEVENHKFLLAPVGIDEGDNIEEKVQIAELGAGFLLSLDIEPKIAVLSGGRRQDVGRSPKIDISIEDGEKLTQILKNKYSVKHYYILIEESIKDRVNFILAPDGITGNLIFRTLVLLGSIKSHGAVTLGINEIFIDTSRSQTVEGYIRALELSNYLASLKSRNKHANLKTSL